MWLGDCGFFGDLYYYHPPVNLFPKHWQSIPPTIVLHPSYQVQVSVGPWPLKRNVFWNCFFFILPINMLPQALAVHTATMLPPIQIIRFKSLHLEFWKLVCMQPSLCHGM